VIETELFLWNYCN